MSFPTGTSPTGTSPTGTSPTGTSPTGTSPTGTSPRQAPLPGRDLFLVKLLMSQWFCRSKSIIKYKSCLQTQMNAVVPKFERVSGEMQRIQILVVVPTQILGPSLLSI